MKSLFFLFPAIALSLAAIRESTNPLCSLQLRDNSSIALIERTNDWTVVPWTSHTLWPSAYFYIALDGTMYGENGKVCSFSRMHSIHFQNFRTSLIGAASLKCAFNATTAGADKFTATTDGRLSLNGQTDFWSCPDLDGDGHHAEPAPLIFPPTGYLDPNDESNYGSCNATTLYTRQCLTESDFLLDPENVRLSGSASTSTNTQQEMTSDSERTTLATEYAIIGLAVSLLLAQ